MTEKPSRWAWRRAMLASSLADGVKVVLCGLTEFINDASGKAWPSVGTLVDTCGKSESAVHRSLKSARTAGWLVYEERPGRTTEYTMAVPRGVPLVTPLTHEGGATDDKGRGSMGDTPGVPSVAPEPFIEPSNQNLNERASAGTGMEDEEKKAINLPVAGFDERVGWSTNWPESQNLEYWPTHSEEARWTRIVNVAFELLGWANKGDSREAFRPIHRALNDGFEYRGVLLDRYNAGQLTTVDLANALAVAGISPPLLAAQENSNEEAA